MGTLAIHLQEGFANEDVILRVDGVEVMRSAGVSTSLLTGLAKSVRHKMAAASADVEIELPRRGLRRSRNVPVGDYTTVAFSVRQDDIEISLFDGPIGYA